VIVVTGLERVYVGDHWPSDVVGGYYFGALFLAAIIWVEREVVARWRPSPARGAAAEEGAP
jgi:undecaprenyl-diphosphatase